MKMKIFRQLDPRENRLPADTSRTIQKKPHRTVPLVDPSFFVTNNPAISRMVGQPVNPKEIRMDFQARLERAVDSANRQIQSNIRFRSVKFDVDQESGRPVAVVRDRASGAVLKQIPSEQMLTMAARLREASGLLQDITI